MTMPEFFVGNARLKAADLFSLEQYAAARVDLRRQAVAHRNARRLALGDNLILSFEDRITMQYQIQEMLRIERIFETAGIEDELGVYNPLIPDGSNFKATMLIEFPDVEQRRQELQKLVGIEDRVWMQVDGHDPVFAIADEDLQRSTEEKTSAVHFLRFELSPAMISDLKSGKTLSAGVDHPHYRFDVTPLEAGLSESLLNDLA
jgi:hypothetical protein